MPSPSDPIRKISDRNSPRPTALNVISAGGRDSGIVLDSNPVFSYTALIVPASRRFVPPWFGPTFHLTAEFANWEVQPGKTVRAWTFNGTVPGPMIKVANGDRNPWVRRAERIEPQRGGPNEHE
jgi:hypothetical protein